MRKVTSVVLPFLLILLAGCNSKLYTKYAVQDPVQKMDEKMLLAKLGRPDRVIETSDLSGPRTYSLLYASAEGCVSTYTINAATKKVREYRCIY